MRIDVHMELDDGADEIDIAGALFKASMCASNIATQGPAIAVGEERHVDVKDLPAVWSVSIFRPQ